MDNIDYLDLTIAKENRRTESALSTISGKSFGKESVLTALVPKKPVALSVDSTKPRFRQNQDVDKTKMSTMWVLYW